MNFKRVPSRWLPPVRHPTAISLYQNNDNVTPFLASGWILLLGQASELVRGLTRVGRYRSMRSFRIDHEPPTQRTGPYMHEMQVTSQLEGVVTGRVITPGTDDYDAARIPFYPFFDRRPAVIVQPADAKGVATVVSVAADTSMELSVRSGGHSLAGHGVTEGGIMLDLSAMTGLQIDPSEHAAWAETGLTAGRYTVRAGAHGLATGFGDTGSVGIGGITLGGGVGYLVRKHGLTIDNLLAADIVVADGSLIRADSETNPDLFWAIRGGGGNFGVATRFLYRLHPVDQIIGGMLILPATAEVVTQMVGVAEAAPDELSTIANIMLAPPMPGLSEEYVGQPVIMLLMTHVGPIEAGEKAVAEFRALATPIVDMVGRMSYPEIYQFTDEVPEIKNEVARSLFVDEVDLAGAGAIIEHLHQTSAPIAVAQLRVLGGAMARIADDATAFAHRQRRVMVAVGVVYDDAGEGDMHRDWVTRLTAALARGEPGVYVGFLGNEGEQRVREAYPGSTWSRLAEVKAKYDPNNLFRLNQNVPPSTT
jgi:FAD/FMN-containing dehydrogenase